MWKLQQVTNHLKESSYSNFTRRLYRVVSAPDQTNQIEDHYNKRTIDNHFPYLIVQTIFIIGHVGLH